MTIYRSWKTAIDGLQTIRYHSDLSHVLGWIGFF